MVKEEVRSNEYADFYSNYIKLAPHNKSITECLAISAKEIITFYSILSEEKLLYRYAEGKWTLKEMLVHIIDTERIFSYRALRFARKDSTTLHGFEQDDYVPYSNANNRTLENLLEEYTAVRKATTTLFASFDRDNLKRIGYASNNAISVRAIGFIISGHEIHHLKIAKERYM
ncbi:MAG: DinB family protein [Flavobacteriales bacterium]|nr:DinB family protein [Flavobacteriales bacterium]